LTLEAKQRVSDHLVFDPQLVLLGKRAAGNLDPRIGRDQLGPEERDVHWLSEWRSCVACDLIRKGAVAIKAGARVLARGNGLEHVRITAAVDEDSHRVTGHAVSV
jgi:hypothetical protein